MNDEMLFMRAVCADPHDDGPRLVYADWLEEQGEAGRAEFIRVQCRLADMPYDHPDRGGLEKREHALWKANVKKWRKPLPPRHRVGPFYRGFVTPGLGINIRDLLDEYQFPAELPLWRASLHGVGFAKAKPTDLPILNRLVHICLSHVPPSWSKHILGSLQVKHLVSLSMGMYQPAMPEIAAVIAESPHLSRLTGLDLGNNALGVAGGKALAASPYLRRLRNVRLSVAELGDEGVIALAGSPILDSVVKLELCSNHLTDRAADALIESPHLKNVRNLQLAHNTFGAGRNKALLKRFGRALVQ